MPFSGGAGAKTFARNTGVYSGTTAWAQTDAASRGIRSDDHDQHDQDIATAVNTSLQKNGDNSLTASIPAAGFGLTGLGVLASVAEVSVSSASTCNILASAAIFVLITGTVTVTSLGTGTNQFKIVRFNGILTLTHNGTSLILPGGANITTAANDMMGVVSDGSSNARVIWYQRASGLTPAARASFSAYKSGDQVIASTAYTKVSFDTEDFDVGSAFDSATNYRWTPPNGTAYLHAAVSAINVATGSITAVKILKNGTTIIKEVNGLYEGSSTTNPIYMLEITAIDQANGTDYYELWFATSDAAYSISHIATAYGSGVCTYFTGHMI